METSSSRRVTRPWRDTELWSLREDVTIEAEPGDGAVRLRGRWGDYTLPRPTPLTRMVLARMSLGPISLENALAGRELNAGAAEAELAILREVLQSLQPLIVRTLQLLPGQPMLTAVPLTARSRFRLVTIDRDVPVRMSKFAEMRSNGRDYYIESPLALYRVLLNRPEAMAVVAALAGPVRPADVIRELSATVPMVSDALDYLVAAGVAVQAVPADQAEWDAAAAWAGQAVHAGGAVAAAGRIPSFQEDRDSALTSWSPLDMMFHTRSTLGRHDQNFGITYPAGQRTPTEPVVLGEAAKYVELPRPRWADLARGDPPLSAVMEGRRSMRRNATSMTMDQLGELLYRTARVRALITLDRPASGSPGYELSDRPYPSGGACYELELYITVSDCDGLAPGVYHYDPLRHRLEPVAAEAAAIDDQLRCARAAAALDRLPPVLISMTARFRRLSWKYEGLAYRMVLMHVGVMVQNFYLVCTAMRLAPCAVGSLSIEVAARALCADWRTEPCVGQFIVGGDPGDTTGPDRSQWRNANDAEWADLAQDTLSRRQIPET